MICLDCRHEIKDNVESCPFCGVKYNSEKLRFIRYIGEPDSLMGYQKSYKLVLLKYVFEFIQSDEDLSVDRIMCKIKSFYLKRVQNGLKADYNVDARIERITESTTTYDIWAVFKANPYNAINNQGFLFLEKNNRGELIFVLAEDIIGNLTRREIDNLVAVINEKLNLYYAKYKEESKSDVAASVSDEIERDEDGDIHDEPKSNETDRITPIEQTPLSARSKHCLMRRGYTTVQEILGLKREDLYGVTNMGEKSIEEILALIASYNSGLYGYEEPVKEKKNIKPDINCPVQDACLITGNNSDLSVGDDLVKEEKLAEITLDCPLQNTPLSARAKNALLRRGYKVVGDITSIKIEQLNSMRNVGQLTAQEILEFVASFGFTKNSETAENEDAGIENETDVLSQSIESTNLSTRAKNALKSCGYKNLDDILDITESKLDALPSVGKNTREEILLFSFSLKQEVADKFEDKDNSFESIKYPYININPECVAVPVSVLRGFGMRLSLIKKLHKTGVYTLGQLKEMDYVKIHDVMGADWIELLHYSLSEFHYAIKDVIKAFLDKNYCEYDLNCIVARSRGATLQEIGNKMGLTRERVRQKIEKPLSIIKPIAVCLAKTLINKLQVKYLTPQDIYDVYDNVDYGAIISFALSESEEIEKIDALGFYFIREDVPYERILSQAICEYVGSGVFWQKDVNQLIEILQEKDLSFLDLNDVWFYALSKGYKAYGGYVVPHTVAYGKLLAIIINEEFPEGISFTDENAVALLRRRACERFGDLELPEENKSLSARVVDLLVLCDCGRWISPNRVFVENSTLETIKAFIDKSEQNTIYYQALFNQFKGLLAMTSDIFNYHYLHGVLKYYYAGEYSFYKDYLKKEKEVVTGSLATRIYEYINNKGVAVSREELKKHLKISSDVMVFNAIANSKNVFQWGANYYNCLGNIVVNEIEKDLLNEIIMEVFAKNQNYCSAKIMFEYCEQLMPELLERNSLNNATHLFYLVATIMGNKYKCRIPHILPYDSTIFTTEEVARMFMKNPIKLNLDDFLSMSDHFGWGRSTAGIVFGSLTREYYRVSKNDYLRKDELILSKEQISQIQSVLEDSFTNKKFLGVWDVCFNDFPDIGYDWTVYLLETVIEHYIKEYRVILPIYSSNKAERGVCVPLNSKLMTFDQIVLDVMNDNNKTTATESEMYTMLVLSGVIKNSIPNELKESKLIEFKNGMYTVRENV